MENKRTPLMTINPDQEVVLLRQRLGILLRVTVTNPEHAAAMTVLQTEIDSITHKHGGKAPSQPKESESSVQ